MAGDFEILLNLLALHSAWTFPSASPTTWNFPLVASASLVFGVALVNVYSRRQLLGIFFQSIKLVFQCLGGLPMKTPFWNKGFLSDLLYRWPSLLTCWARIKSLCSSVSLIRKTKTIPLLSASQVCENKQASAGGAGPVVGLKGRMEGWAILLIVTTSIKHSPFALYHCNCWARINSCYLRNTLTAAVLMPI